MRTIGVRELKANLSRILRELQTGGDIVLVTDRRRVVAELRPPTGAPADESATDRGLRGLAASGAVRVAEPRREPYRKSPLRLPLGTGRDLIAEEREER